MATSSQTALVVRMTITAWDTQNNYLQKLINELTDEQFQHEIAPGRNTGVYLLGHLIAVSDAMLPLLGFGEKLYPSLEQTFLRTPDKSGQEMPTVTDLKTQLEAVNAKLQVAFKNCSEEDWLNRHMSVTAEDFAKEPHRNKLNVLISRTNHMANHIGQLLLLKGS